MARGEKIMLPPVEQRTIKDFPIGSRWKEQNLSNKHDTDMPEYIVVNNNGNKTIGFQVVYIPEKYKDCMLMNKLYYYDVDKTDWALPIKSSCPSNIVLNTECLCSIQDLMIHGCLCGAIEKERANG